MSHNTNSRAGGSCCRATCTAEGFLAGPVLSDLKTMTERLDKHGGSVRFTGQSCNSRKKWSPRIKVSHPYIASRPFSPVQEASWERIPVCLTKTFTNVTPMRFISLLHILIEDIRSTVRTASVLRHRCFFVPLLSHVKCKDSVALYCAHRVLHQ